MREDASARRSVVPQAAGRSLWLAAAWTGAGAAIVCAVTAIAVVAVCWLPAAGGSGSARSAIRAGVLTFLAALHGGITVDGLPSAFVPLGMTIAVGAVAWRAGSGLADAARALDEEGTARLVQAVAVQVLAFAVTCGLGARFATLGGSRVSVLAAVLAGAVLFAATGGVAFVRSSPLGAAVGDEMPRWVAPCLRAAAAGLAVYLAAGALLVAGSLAAHHGRVEALSSRVGGGWSGVPVLLLGLLAAPNAMIAGASYLAGPGFALGSGSGVTLGATVHGTLPAFPILGAVPAGPATAPVWVLTALTPIVAAGYAARAATAGTGWPEALRNVAGAAGAAALVGAALAWQGGGAIGSGRLSAFGASPWQFGLATGGALGIVSGVLVLARAALARLRARTADEPAAPRAWLAAVRGGASRDDPDEEDALAG